MLAGGRWQEKSGNRNILYWKKIAAQEQVKKEPKEGQKKKVDGDQMTIDDHKHVSM